MPLRMSLLALALVAALVSCGGDAADEGQIADSSPPTDTESADTEPTPPPTASPPIGTDPVPAEPAPIPESSVWVHLFDDTLKTPEGVEAMLDEVAEAGIDAVIAQVARRHDAYYDSGYLPPTPDPALADDFDVLDALVAGAHARGLQIHAWFVVAPATHPEYDDLDLPAGHVWVEHGPDSADSWVTRDAAGRSADYFDVGIEPVHDHVASIISDIASRYDVDGVHLDYVRYDGAEWGYHPDALSSFAAATGRTDVPTIDDPDWVAWRTSRTADLIDRARDALTDARPEARLSVAVIAGGEGPSARPDGFAGTRAASGMFQDWPTWVADGSVDFVIAMAYTREGVPDQARWFRQWVEFAGELADDHPGRVAIGIGAYLNPVESGLTQLDLAREATGHVAIYSYQQDSSDSERGELMARCCGP